MIKILPYRKEKIIIINIIFLLYKNRIELINLLGFIIEKPNKIGIIKTIRA